MAPNTAQTAVSTPTKAPATPTTESPGTWRHPRLEEITKRQQASTFSDKNITRIVINVSVLIALVILHSFVKKALLPARRVPPHGWINEDSLYYLLLALPLFNIAMSFKPLFGQPDDLADIALTPGQRKLLGLPPPSAPPTPGSVYSTPPRYARTPSVSGSTGRRSFSSSPILNRSPSNQGSPTPAGNGSGLTSPSHHLLQRAMLGARRSSLGSMGSPSPIGGGFLGGASIFGNGPESPSTSPAGKSSTVGLSNKYRYEKGMKTLFRDFDSDLMFA
ncbi:nuclear pore complex component-domain-containing protein [Hypoxylon argillaceum]|nr:nuclear pore complex component-domain-containing protein [Hypoxylon argillaceum]